ncbi:C40 family peptidase [Candidatus Nomurabacteria bacterium]|nr:C40 family peptidase [Candidatus Nomurabacteria bacterium]
MNFDTIKAFQELDFWGTKVQCPYFINKGNRVRAALRVMCGKGTPEEIVDEAKTLALREGINLKEKNADEVKAFLVDHNLGIDCSGLAYYILQPQKLFFPHAKNFLRKFITKMRPIENCSVEVLAHEKNSKTVSLSQLQPGDMIIMIGTGDDHDLNHVLVVTREDNGILHYAHSLQWKSDGKYGGGVKAGKIEIVDRNKTLLEQKWTEDSKSGDENETFWRAKTAHSLKIHRLL